MSSRLTEMANKFKIRPKRMYWNYRVSVLFLLIVCERARVRQEPFWERECSLAIKYSKCMWIRVLWTNQRKFKHLCEFANFLWIRFFLQIAAGFDDSLERNSKLQHTAVDALLFLVNRSQQRECRKLDKLQRTPNNCQWLLIIATMEYWPASFNMHILRTLHTVSVFAYYRENIGGSNFGNSHYAIFGF